MSDELYDLRNAFVLGNFGQVISEGASIKSNPYRKSEDNDALLAERDTLVFKAHLGLSQFEIVIDDLAAATSPNLKAIRLLAQYLKAAGGRNEAAMAATVTNAKEFVKSCEATVPASSFVHVAITTATLLIHAGELEPALKGLRTAQAQLTNTQSPALLELHALATDILLRIYRVDQAEKEVKVMQAMDDDATLTQLSTAWVYVAQGGEKLPEAIQVFDDLKEKFGPSVILLNGIALAQMALGHFDVAEKLLLEAMSKRSSDPETSINLTTCAVHQHKPLELVTRYVTQLKTTAPTHPWVVAYLALEKKFDSVADANGKPPQPLV